MKAFASGLARGMRRLRVLGDAIDRSSRGRVLRAAGVCLSKVLETGKDKTHRERVTVVR